MNAQDYLEKMKSIQNNTLIFLEDDKNIEENYGNLKNSIDILGINNSNKLKSILRFVVKIGNNHHRKANFFSKIERIIGDLTKHIKKYLTKSEIFNIFKKNKRILLFLIENKIINIDETIFDTFMERKYLIEKYPEYFLPEILPFIEKYSKSNDRIIPERMIKYLDQNLPEDFMERRKLVDNNDEISKIIQSDSVKNFISYVKRNNFALNSQINLTFYETNPILLRKRKLSLIEFATFYGSFNIFKYLISQDIELTPSLWILAIHGNDEGIIHLLEDKKVFPEDWKMVYIESIKCHHNQIAFYIRNNYLQDDDCYDEIIKNYNFCLIQNQSVNIESFFYDFCKYDYFYVVNDLIKKKNIDINMEVIYK